jgi:hypothetical protein
MPDWTTAAATVEALVNALNSFDWTRANEICETLSADLRAAREPFPKDEATWILKALRRKRQFAPMALVAEALIDTGRHDADIQTFHAQALIDQGQLTPAQAIARAVASDAAVTPNDRAEAFGMLGRIYKQRYVLAKQPDHPRQQENLKQALANYHEIYGADASRTWHGINVVALLARADRDHVDVGDAQRRDFRAIATAILDHLKGREREHGVLPYWDRAISMEAHIALGQFDEARADLKRYMADAAADAFECASTLRQLREVWQIDEKDGPGAAIVAGLRSAMLQRLGGEVELKKSDVQLGLQANFGAVADLPLQWWKTGLQRCAAVGRIENLAGRRLGTGFVVRREDFLGEPGPPLLMTNWHVVSEGGEHELSIGPENARATFEACDRVYKIGKEIVAYSRRLDVSLLALEEYDEAPGFCPLDPPPVKFATDKRPRLYIIGYPGGRGLSFSLHDSEWLDTDGTLLHYRTPTEPGSSGSPVFDQDNWTLIALHHRGLPEMNKLNGQSGTYEANEGIAVSAIRDALRSVRKS